MGEALRQICSQRAERMSTDGDDMRSVTSRMFESLLLMATQL